MGFILVAAFIGVPILEIAVFIQAGELIGLWPTLAAIVVTAVIGAALVRQQGFSTLMRARESLDAGRFPVNEVFDGFCLLVAGAFLVTPGFITDATGFLLLVPAVRAVLRRRIAHMLMESGRVTVWADGRPPPPGGRDGVIIDGDFEPLDTSGDDTPRAPGDPRRGPASDASPWNRKPPGA